MKDAYFGKVAADRLTVREDKEFMVFPCDGKERLALRPVSADVEPAALI